jgi:hypothetical protein
MGYTELSQREMHGRDFRSSKTALMAMKISREPLFPAHKNDLFICCKVIKS